MQARKRKMEFLSISKLAAYLGEVTNIYRTNFTRNKKYKDLLLTYPYLKIEGVDVQSYAAASPEVMKTRLLGLRLENANLQAKLKHQEALKKQELISLSSSRVENKGDYYIYFVDTAMALIAIMERQKDIMAINLETNSIEEIGGKPSEKIIVGPQRLKHFLDWYKENRNLFPTNLLASEK